MRNRKKRKTGSFRIFTLAALVLLVPISLRLIIDSVPWLSQAGQSAAMLSAALVMPDGSVDVLKERFRAEIYNPDGDHATGDTEQGAPLPEPAIIPEQSERSDLEEEPTDDDNSMAPSATGPRIPAQYAAPIISEDFSGVGGTALVTYGAGLIKNETTFEPEEIREILDTPYPIEFIDTAEPQVLIVHTHATESFESYDSPTYDTRNTWRSTDNKNNMVAVGDALAQVLESSGIGVIHDTTQHDYPSYNGSYDRSAETIRAYLEEYPTIKVVLDLHRDAMQRDDSIVKPVAVIDGKKAAQVMIISACDDGDMDIPNWRDNLRFAAALQDRMESASPGLTRPVYFCYRKYNMDLTNGSLLIEIGSNANTLEESIYSATLAGHALSDLILDNIQNTNESNE